MSQRATSPVPQRVTGHVGDWRLHDSARSRALELAATAAATPHELMARAGAAVARLAQALAPHAPQFGILCGPGNNGGDGLVAATRLLEAGRTVVVDLFGDRARMPDDAAWALRMAQAAGVTIRDAPSESAAAAAPWVIDALLGLGARRAIEGPMADAIGRVNRGSAQVLAVDLPTGLDADTGHGADVAMRATHTLSLLTLKPGLFTAQGRDLAGQVWFESLGVQAPPQSASARLSGLAERDACWPPRRHGGHKGSFGDVAAIGGAQGMTGAVWLAAQAALAAGAGRVYCSPLDERADLLLPQRPELMGRRHWWLGAPATLVGTTVVCGCGGGTAVHEVLPPLLAHAGRLVIDADGLNAVAGDASLQRQLRARADRGLHTILTPHPLEAARLAACSAAQIQADRLGSAQALARRYGTIVVLKGSGTVIAAPRGVPIVNSSGNALLASAGTGDVLAGWIAGHWCASAGAGTDSAVQSAAASVWLHGHAADRAAALPGRAAPIRAGDLIELMRGALVA